MAEGNSQSPSFFNGLVMGMVAGAAAYFLLATKKGRRVSKQIMKRAQEGWEEVEETVDKAEKMGEHLSRDVKKLRTKIEKDTVKVQAKATQELQQLQEKVDQAREKADDMQTSLRQAAAKIERRFFLRNGRSLGK